jgi:hypothetical protein
VSKGKANSRIIDFDNNIEAGCQCAGGDDSDAIVYEVAAGRPSSESANILPGCVLVGVSERGSGPHASIDTESSGNSAPTEPARAAGTSSAGGGQLGAASADAAAHSGGLVPLRAETVRIRQHQSFDEVREWLDSPELKDARKKLRDDAKAKKKAAASKDAVIATATNDLRLDAMTTEHCDQDEIANDSDSDEEEWAPSTVSYSCKEYIQVTRLTGGDAIRLYRQGPSGVALYLVYDHVTGEALLAQIQSVWYDRKQRQWQMKYSRVYSTEMAIIAAEQEDDKEVVLSGGTMQTDKVVIQRGRRYLRDLLQISDRLHHIGDVRISWNPIYIVGITAMWPASALISCNESDLAERQDQLKQALMNSYGVNANEARRLAANPIYVGEYFSEARPEVVASDEQSSDSSDSDGEEQLSDALVQRPSRGPLRRLRARIASGEPHHFTLCHDDDDDIPLFGDKEAAGRGRAVAGATTAGRQRARPAMQPVPLARPDNASNDNSDSDSDEDVTLQSRIDAVRGRVSLHAKGRGTGGAAGASGDDSVGLDSGGDGRRMPVAEKAAAGRGRGRGVRGRYRLILLYTLNAGC